MQLSVRPWPSILNLPDDIKSYSNLLSNEFNPDERCRERLLLNEFESIAMGSGILINPGKVDFNKLESVSLSLRKDHVGVITYEDLSRLITGSDDPMRSLLSKRTEHIKKYDRPISGLVYYLVTLSRCHGDKSETVYVISEYDKYIPQILSSLDEEELARDLIIDTLYDIRNNKVIEQPEKHFISDFFCDDYCYSFRHPKDVIVLLIAKYLELLIKVKRYSDIDLLLDQVVPLNCYEGLARQLVVYFKAIDIEQGMFFFEFEKDFCSSIKMKNKNLTLAIKELSDDSVR